MENSKLTFWILILKKGVGVFLCWSEEGYGLYIGIQVIDFIINVLLTNACTWRGGGKTKIKMRNIIDLFSLIQSNKRVGEHNKFLTTFIGNGQPSAEWLKFINHFYLQQINILVKDLWKFAFIPQKNAYQNKH